MAHDEHAASPTTPEFIDIPTLDALDSLETGGMDCETSLWWSRRKVSRKLDLFGKHATVDSRRVRRRTQLAEQNDHRVHEAEAVMGVRLRDGQPQYLVRWMGCSAESDTWEPRESFLSAVPIDRWTKHVAETEARRHTTAASAQRAEVDFAGVQARLLRRGFFEKLAASLAESSDDPLGWLPLLRGSCRGLFVRLKVSSVHQLAQVVDVVNLPDRPYMIDGSLTYVHLVVDVAGRRALPLSCLADGAEVPEVEFRVWCDKLAAGQVGSFVHLHHDQLSKLADLERRAR